MGPLLVTGCFRSGTTLIEKLLHQHPQLCVASQPLPILYYLAKERFLESRGLARRYALGHLFDEAHYGPADFGTFLDTFELTAGDLDLFWDRLTDWEEAHWTREVLQLRGRIAPGPFGAVYQQLIEATAGLLGGGERIGSKEVLVEEYLPWLLRGGGFGVVSVRDPRDLITSQDFNQRANTTGTPRPLLYSLRVWRKSVAYALHLADHPRCAWHRYEDLVTDPASVLDPLAKMLEVRPFQPVAELTAQGGGAWTGNSSFEGMRGISTASVGRFADVLPEPTVRYIEAVCGPEMDTLGYVRTTDAAPTPDELSAYREPHPALHRAFPSDYSTDPQRVADEVGRGARTVFAGRGLLLALLVVLGLGCSPEPAPTPEPPARYLISELEFVLEDEDGLPGFDLDGNADDCGVEDGLSPAGLSGIDNQLGAIWDVLPDSAIAALPLAINGSLESGAMMVVLEVPDGPEADFLTFREGAGRPLLGNDRRPAPNQTIDLEAGDNELGSAELSAGSDGVLRVDDMSIVLKLEYIDTHVVMPVIRGRGELTPDGEGGFDLSLGGAVPMASVMEVVAGLGGDGDDALAATLKALLPLVVDVRTEPDGACDGLSGAFVGHAVPVFLFEE